jgi:hypothetical protein
MLKQTDLYELVPTSVWKQEWVCHIQPVGSGEATLKYLAPDPSLRSGQASIVVPYRTGIS